MGGRYSEVSNKQACSLIKFEEKFHPAGSYSILLVYQFSRKYKWTKNNSNICKKSSKLKPKMGSKDHKKLRIYKWYKSSAFLIYL